MKRDALVFKLAKEAVILFIFMANDLLHVVKCSKPPARGLLYQLPLFGLRGVIFFAELTQEYAAQAVLLRTLPNVLPQAGLVPKLQ